MKKLILFVLLISVSRVFSQRNFTFNLPGNECYFNYTCFSQTNEYNSPRHPFIFILGKQGETAEQAFEADTLKKLPKFFNYKFVYLPNDISSPKKLDCFYALVGLVTYNFAFGKNNLFFQVNDNSITQAEIKSNGMNTIFKSVRLSNSEIDTSKKELAKKDISEDFKETIVDYDTQKDADKFGTFYEDAEPTASEQKDADMKVAQKVYFGPPETLNYNLTGIIRDKSTGEALPFANILIKGTAKGASTNPDGYFTLLKVPSDTSVLVVQYVGYDKTEIYLTPILPKKNFIIELQPSNNLKTITVTTYKEDVVLINKTDVSTIKMTPKKLEQLPNIGERDIMRSFQLMPGVSASNESSSGLYVRGGTPDQNLVLYDGFTVYQVDHLYGFFSAFNSNALKDVQLHKGGFESKFGGRLSSVTEITSKDGNQNKFNVGGDISLLSTNIYAELPIGKKFSSIFAFRRSYQGPIYNLIFKEFNNTQASSGNGRFSQNTTVKSFFYDLNGKFTYRPNDKDIISLSIYNGTDKLDNSSASGNRSFGNSNTTFSFNSSDLTTYGNIGSSLKWSRKWRPRFYGNTILSYSNYYSNRNKSTQVVLTRSTGETTTTNSGIFENNDLKDYSAKSDYQWDLFRFSQLQFGGYATYFDIKYKYAQNDTLTILDRHDMTLLTGGYIQSNTKLFKDKVHFVPGVRTSYFQTTNKLYYEPRASLTISLTDQLTLKGATGKYYQFTNRITREDILAGSRDFWIMSDNQRVPISSAIHYIAGLSYETKNFLFSTEGYYKKLDGLTQYSLRFNASPSGTNYNENFFNGNGFSRGIEFLAQKKSGNFNGWVSYTLGQARNHFNVYGDGYFPADQDVTHEFKIVLLYKYKRWNFSATWIYATGRPYTAPSGAYNVTLLDGSAQSFFTVTSKNGLRLPDYHRADVSANYKLLTGEHGDKKRREIGYIGFSIFNVYDHVNVWYKQYAIVNGTILETNVNYLGLVPNLTLSVKLR